jgi:hypothetical protein
MKRLFTQFLMLAAVAVVMQSCSSSVALDARWSNPDLDGVQAKKILVMVVGQNMRARQVAEDAFEASLAAQGFNSVGALDVLPISSGAIDSATLVRVITDMDIDVVITARAVDVNTKQHWVPGTTSYPMHYGSYGGYYGRYGGYGGYGGYYGTTSQGYMDETTTALLETNLFDVNAGELAWVGQSSVIVAGNTEKLIEKYATVVVNGMVADGVLKK